MFISVFKPTPDISAEEILRFYYSLNSMCNYCSQCFCELHVPDNIGSLTVLKKYFSASRPQ